jgi:tRNA (cmo5U34)-methyltransferase
MANARGALSTSVHAPTAPNKSSLDHMPPGQWTFDDDVTDVFDDMLARSIPQIEAMRELVCRAATRFVQPGTHILDLGCSLGTAMAPLVERFHTSNRFVGIEASPPMVAACRERFQNLIDAGIVEIHAGDLRSTYPHVDASVTLCVLALMFTPIEHRFRILADVFAHTRSGGAFILVEKVLGADANLDRLLTSLYYDHKRAMGYTDEAIDRKRLSLEGVLVPVTATWNEQMLRDAGFQHVECFWRCLNFAGWLAIKA